MGRLVGLFVGGPRGEDTQASRSYITEAYEYRNNRSAGSDRL